MPETIAIVTALITDHPLCLACLTHKADSTRQRISTALRHIQQVLNVTRHTGRCRACGTLASVVAIERPKS